MAVAPRQDSAGTLYSGELEIRIEEGLAIAAGRALTLSVREFDLLVALAARTGAITRREDLYKQVWGSELRSGDRSVDVYVSKLRNKLQRAMPDRRFIHTHPGFGYRFQPQPTTELSRDVHNGGAPPQETGPASSWHSGESHAGPT